MPSVTGLVVKIVELCNLNCSYCYMYNHVDQSYRGRPKFMSMEVFAQLVERIAEHLDRHGQKRMSLVFHGGEPMLMDPAAFRRLVEAARARLGGRVSFGMQTNGTLVTDEWLRTLLDLKLHPGVSLDGPAAMHDQFRVYHDGRGSYEATLDGLERMKAAGLKPSILCVISPGRDGLAIYRHFRSLGLRSIDFLPPEVSHDTRDTYAFSPSATPVADYLIPIFDEWFREDDPTVHIRLFRGVLRALMGGASRTEAIGGGSLNYLIIDTDGSIHANDCLKVCEPGLSDSGLNIARHGFDDLAAGLPLVHRLVFEGLGVAEGCRQCPELSTCGGGSAPNRYSRARGFDNPSVWCEDLKKLIGHVRGVLEHDGHTDLLASGDVLHQRDRGLHPQPAGT